MSDVGALGEPELLAAARRGDAAAFERLVASHRADTPLRLLDTRTWEGSDNVLVRYAVAPVS